MLSRLQQGGNPTLMSYTLSWGSGSGTSSGGSSSGGSNTGTSVNPAAETAMVAAEMHSQFGLLPSSFMHKIAAHAIAGKWDVDQIAHFIRSTAVYNKAYAGIKRNPGMDENTYASMKQNFKDYAAANHVDVSQAQIVKLFKNQVSLTEANDRFAAESKLNSNPGLFSSFNTELQAQGKQPLDHAGQIAFILGAAHGSYYNVWNLANGRYEAGQAGLKIDNSGSADSLTYAQLKQGTMLQQTSKAGAQGSWSDMAKLVGQILPQSQLQGFGLTTDDMMQAEFGGPKQAKIDQLIQQLGANQKAFDTQKINNTTSALGQRGARERVQ
jgi:hypothetical protein